MLKSKWDNNKKVFLLFYQGEWLEVMSINQVYISDNWEIANKSHVDITKKIEKVMIVLNKKLIELSKDQFSEAVLRWALEKFGK